MVQEKKGLLVKIKEDTIVENPPEDKQQSSQDKYLVFTNELKDMINKQIEKVMIESTKNLVPEIITALDSMVTKKINDEMEKLTNSIKDATI